MREASCCRVIVRIGMIEIWAVGRADRREMDMATGMFRTDEGWVQVDYDGSNIPVPRSKYEENGYKPDFDELPLEADYWAAQEKAQRAAMPRIVR
jgi:hypothetical protein